MYLGAAILKLDPDESEELIINQSGNAIDLACTVNLRNTFPDGFASLVLRFWNSGSHLIPTFCSCHTNN